MGVRIISVDDYERRQHRIIYILITIVTLGLIYFVYEDIQNTSITRLPENLSQLESLIADWKAENFIRSFDVAQSTVVVDEQVWNERTRGEKLDFVLQLARYCARKNRSRQWTLQVISRQNKRILAEIGKTDFRVE